MGQRMGTGRFNLVPPTKTDVQDEVQQIDQRGNTLVNLAGVLTSELDSIRADPPETVRVNSVAYAASLILKAGPGTLFSLDVYNSLNAAQWIQLHDSLTLPADAAVPVWIGTVATVANLEKRWPNGLNFTTGIVVCNSTTGPTKTIGAADCFFTGVVDHVAPGA